MCVVFVSVVPAHGGGILFNVGVGVRGSIPTLDPDDKLHYPVTPETETLAFSLSSLVH